MGEQRYMPDQTRFANNIELNSTRWEGKVDETLKNIAETINQERYKNDEWCHTYEKAREDIINKCKGDSFEIQIRDFKLKGLPVKMKYSGLELKKTEQCFEKFKKELEQCLEDLASLLRVARCV